MVVEQERLLDDKTLENKINAHQKYLNKLLAERDRRKQDEQKRDWDDVIDAINNYVEKYGPIQFIRNGKPAEIRPLNNNIIGIINPENQRKK